MTTLGLLGSGAGLSSVAALSHLELAPMAREGWGFSGSLRAGGIPGQPGPDTPAEPGVPPEQPVEPGIPTLPDEPPPAPVV